jgi:hypothetical protein
MSIPEGFCCLFEGRKDAPLVTPQEFRRFSFCCEYDETSCRTARAIWVLYACSFHTLSSAQKRDSAKPNNRDKRRLIRGFLI